MKYLRAWGGRPLSLLFAPPLLILMTCITWEWVGTMEVEASLTYLTLPRDWGHHCQGGPEGHLDPQMGFRSRYRWKTSHQSQLEMWVGLSC